MAYSKVVQTGIKKYGSYEKYCLAMSNHARKGGRAPHPNGRGFQLMDKKKLSDVSRKAGKMGRRVYPN